MPQKGYFTQCFTLLTDGRTTLADIRRALEEAEFEITKETPAGENWQFGSDSLLIPFLPEVNGYLLVDVVSQPWPDAMGGNQTGDDANTFGAWALGHFGPLTYPGGLSRACDHLWGWEEGRALAQKHRGFIRLMISYSLDSAAEDAPLFPEEYDSLEELMFLSDATLALLEVPGVLCYFNPNGEVLRDAATFRETWEGCLEEEKIPLELWRNIRLFTVDHKISFVDTIGNTQLDIPDVEAFFETSSYKSRDLYYYVGNVTHFLLDLGGELTTGESIDGPGESNATWMIDIPEESIAAPPREAVRLFPKSKQAAVQAALDALSEEE